MLYTNRTMLSRRRVTKESATCKPRYFTPIVRRLIKRIKTKKGPREYKHVQQAYGSFASQGSPTGIVDFELRDCADGDVVASDGPVDSWVAVRSAIHGGVGDVESSDIPVSGGGCDGG